MKLRAAGHGLEADVDAPAQLPRVTAAVRAGNVVWVAAGGETYRIERAVGPGARGADAEEDLRAPMPGKILKMLAKEGDEVEKGRPLLVLEAMKMEHEIRAPRAGKVKKLFFGLGEMVGLGDLLAELEP